MTITESEYSAEEKFGEVKKLGLLSKVIYKYNEKGNLTEQSKYNSDGSIDSREIHKFDTKENEIEWTKYEDGSLKSTVTYKYDDSGHKIESNFDGTYITKYKYKDNIKELKIELILILTFHLQILQLVITNIINVVFLFIIIKIF
jgi:hypothetical protein